MLPDGCDEPVAQPKVGAAPLGANGISAYVGEVVFRDGPADLVDPLDADVGEKPGEPRYCDCRPAAASLEP